VIAEFDYVIVYGVCCLSLRIVCWWDNW